MKVYLLLLQNDIIINYASNTEERFNRHQKSENSLGIARAWKKP